MMRLADNYKKAIESNGVSYSFGDNCGLLAIQSTQLFTRNVEFPCDSPVQSGSVITLGTGDFLVVAMNPEIRNDEVIYISGLLFKCNCLFDVRRPTETEVNYKPVLDWPVIGEGQKGFVSDSPGETIHVGGFGMVMTEGLQLFMPNLGISMEPMPDRLVIDSKDYKPEAIRQYQYDGVAVIALQEDER